MATWVSKIRVVCPTGTRVAKLIGKSYDDALKAGLRLDPGPGCKKASFEVVQRGIGAGQRDRREGERLEGGRRGRRGRRAQWAPDLGADDSHLMTGAYRHVSSFGGAGRKKARR